jgi:hypothetical protein
MPSPSTALTTLRPDLGGSFMEFEAEMAQEGLIAYRVLPVFEAMKQSGKFGRIPLAQLLMKRDVKRSSGSGYARSKYTFTDDSYATDEYGAEEPVDARESAMYSEYFSAEQVSAFRARRSVMEAAEQRVADIVFNTTTWTGAALTTAVSTAWTLANKATATPVDDVEKACVKVWEGSGLWPNSLVIERRCFRALRHMDQIVDRGRATGYFGSGTVRPQDVTAQALAEIFDLEEVIVGGMAKNSANEGATATIASVWDKTKAMVCKVARRINDIREPCVGRCIHWGEDGSTIGGTVESYAEPQTRSDIIRVRHDVDEKIFYAQAGHLLTAVFA